MFWTKTEKKMTQMNLLVLCAGGHFQMGWVFVSVFPPWCLIWCLAFIYTQVSLLSLKYKLLHIFSFLLSITSLKEIDILESSNWIVTKGTVLKCYIMLTCCLSCVPIASYAYLCYIIIRLCLYLSYRTGNLSRKHTVSHFPF